MNDQILKIGKYEFNSRLIVGSGKYKDFQTTREATLASGSELITVAIRRVNITNPNEENLLDYFKDTNIKLYQIVLVVLQLKRLSLLLVL